MGELRPNLDIVQPWRLYKGCLLKIGHFQEVPHRPS